MTASPRSVRAAAIGFTLAIVALLAAACGGSAGPGVASLGSTTTTTSPSSQAQTTSNEKAYVDGVKYAQCMRTHGVTNFPDPNSKGQFLSIHGVLNGQKVDFNSPQYTKANKDCEHLLPNGGQPTAAELQQLLTQALKYTTCLRTHGLPNMPDPVETSGNIGIRFPGGVSPNSPQLQKALAACRSLSPGG